MPATRSLFPRTLEPALSSPESRVLKFHTIRVCTSSTVSAAINADRDRRASLRAHEPPTIFRLRGAGGAAEALRSSTAEKWKQREAEEVTEEEEDSWAFTVAEARRSAEKERHSATVRSKSRKKDAVPGTAAVGNTQCVTSSNIYTISSFVCAKCNLLNTNY